MRTIFKPWAVLAAVGKLIAMAIHLHDAHKMSGKSIEDFVADELINP